MPPNKTIAICSVFAIIFAGCHNPTAQQSDSQQQQAPVTGYNNGPDTSIAKAMVDRNAKEGLNIIKYKSGVIKAKGYYSKGLKEGEWQSFYESGKLWSDEFFTNGLPDGRITVYYESGQKFYEGEFKAGQPVNVWSYWDKGGKLLRTADYNKKSPNTAL